METTHKEVLPPNSFIILSLPIAENASKPFITPPVLAEFAPILSLSKINGVFGNWFFLPIPENQIMHPLSNKSLKPKASPSGQIAPARKPKVKLFTPALLLVVVLSCFLSLLPRLQNLPSKPALNPTAFTVTMSNNQREDKLYVHWSIPTSQAQFWLDNTLTPAQCDQRNCTVPKGSKVGQIYFRWFNNANNRWYYFKCNGDYQGQFQGLPLSS